MSKKVLVLGGTRFFGKYLVQSLIDQGLDVTIATRGNTKDSFGDQVNRIIFDRTDEESIKTALTKETYEVIYDNIAYTSNDIEILLRHVTPKRYIVTSSMSAYHELHFDLKETDFDPAKEAFRLVSSEEVDYAQGKRTVEEILTQKYSQIPSVFVRFPYVIGADDYTKRFTFYIDHLIKQKPMAVDNLTHQMGFVDAQEAGKFLAFLGTSSFTGPINGASKGTVSLEEVLQYVTKKTGLSPLFSETGDQGPYNGTPAYSINVGLAEEIGFSFSQLQDWIYQLCDWEIAQASNE
ncbi:NAD-dependent epimerase/dehydratase family protein [Enterococcus casseliflavus]|jgi:nucleoside-diphosphate-sugar epimerase|uniref:NAD-dependent epimerase/dehydratase family protein n=1 Tax=Enterococcus casseliflavus TaxID=37734 RepID=UPI00201D19DC|nr:NAD-dependent epimerase/dehydratase family protein [Enterococcus casseliflavus]MDV7751123.1 NAD-dependent epimerase/dehydratase family protein [Enterococcus casseliflavus]UQZ97102.1 NAD-dependent epimerase/dehydratase family protein [Enterococcus casseliflavus]